MPPVLYITRNGMMEPLGQSQVMSYLRGLSKDYQITLISFEKAADLDDLDTVKSARSDCAAHGIKWLPQRYYQNPKYLAPLWSMVVLFYLCLREVFRGNAELIHARSYYPAATALVVNMLTRTPFIFDMRALWPEELITARRLRRGSLVHKAIVWAERRCLKKAAAVVCLTHAAHRYLEAQYPTELANQRVIVVPTCADLNRFVPREDESSTRVYGCFGTVLSGWFKQEWLSAIFEYLSASEQGSRFEVITRDSGDEVLESISPSDELRARLKVYAMPPSQIHKAIQNHTASFMFYAGGEVSELGRSPTRMGEVLGCGRPVVANEGVGDVAEIIRKYNVGVVVDDVSTEGMACAMKELEDLLKDPGLPVRCREAAEAVYSLEHGTGRYCALYQSILSASGAVPHG